MLRGLFLTLLISSSALAADPSWFKRKKQVQEDVKQEEAQKKGEQPIVDGGDPNAVAASELSTPKEVKIERNLLFKSVGMTDTFHLDYSSLAQDEVFGPTLTAGASMGWWWQPDLILSGFGRISGTNWESVTLMMVTLGPQLRYFYNKRWSFTGMAGWTYSVGLNRERDKRIPITEGTLRARTGPSFGAQTSYFFWPKRDLGMAPTLGFWWGTQDERTQMQIVLGLTLLAGRPNYTGDVTAW